MKKLKLTLSLIAVAGLSACASTAPYSSAPQQVFVPGKSIQQKPESLSHWKYFASDFASQAAPKLKGIAVSSSAIGVSSPFDIAFHDFLISALHEEGVKISDTGARLEVDTYPLAFNSHPYYIKNPYTNETGTAPMVEFAVNVRVFSRGDLYYSGSKTYYLPESDIRKYMSFPPKQKKQKHGKNIKVVGE